jgi:hypothetical protein
VEYHLWKIDNLDIIKIMVAASELNFRSWLSIHNLFWLITKGTKFYFDIPNKFWIWFSLNSTSKVLHWFNSKNPDKIFKSLDFSSIPEKILIQRDNLMKLKYGRMLLNGVLHEILSFSSDPSNYSKDDLIL